MKYKQLFENLEDQLADAHRKSIERSGHKIISLGWSRHSDDTHHMITSQVTDGKNEKHISSRINKETGHVEHALGAIERDGDAMIIRHSDASKLNNTSN